ncbi:hypothetical protein RIR_e471_A0A2N0NHF9_9GLOM [Rhizophagus irregularis DAOM 181602=DAOM 197198]|nr:hypothetical protein RIR_e471_A0A2N0NHF9_9GLOM [Rhizophagus irregularis DAOM 181602=DAOM 197198]
MNKLMTVFVCCLPMILSEIYIISHFEKK